MLKVGDEAALESIINKNIGNDQDNNQNCGKDNSFITFCLLLY